MRCPQVTNTAVKRISLFLTLNLVHTDTLTSLKTGGKKKKNTGQKKLIYQENKGRYKRIGKQNMYCYHTHG